MSEKADIFPKYADHKIAKYAAKICGNMPRLHIHINLTWYVFCGGWIAQPLLFSTSKLIAKLWILELEPILALTLIEGRFG